MADILKSKPIWTKFDRDI